MRDSELRKLLKEAAGPTPLPSNLRAHLEEVVEDEVGRKELSDVGTPEPLSPFLRKRLERQLTAPRRARRAYRRLQVFSGAAASLIFITLGVGYFASGGNIAGLFRDAASSSRSPVAEPSLRATPSTNKPGTLPSRPPTAPATPPALTALLPEVAAPLQEAPVGTSPNVSGMWTAGLYERATTCQGGPDEGDPVGKVKIQQEPDQTESSSPNNTTPTANPAPSSAATAEATVSPSAFSSAAATTPTASPSGSAEGATPTPSPTTFSSAGSPVVHLSIDLGDFVRTTNYWVLLMTYKESGDPASCGGATYFDEWKVAEEGSLKTFENATIAPGTYIFRVVLEPFDNDKNSLVSEEFIAELE